jgi:hypothetical protein
VAIVIHAMTFAYFNSSSLLASGGKLIYPAGPELLKCAKTIFRWKLQASELDAASHFLERDYLLPFELAQNTDFQLLNAHSKRHLYRDQTLIMNHYPEAWGRVSSLDHLYN